jgi:hypothetical protein
MFYEYANRKAYEIVSLRRDLFGEIVEVISDEAASDNFFAADSQDYEDPDTDEYSSDSDIEDSDEEYEADMEVE